MSTDDQVRYMNRTCGFCSQEYMHGREYMSTFSVYDGVRFWNSMMRFSGSSCGIKKVALLEFLAVFPCMFYS